MNDKPTASSAIGLEINGNEIRIVKLKSTKKFPKLIRFMTIPIERNESNHVKPLYTEKKEKELYSLLNKNLIITNLPSSNILVRTLNVQLTKEKDIDQVLEFQAEPLLPYPVENALIDRIVSGKGIDHTQLTICATESERVAEHISLWHEVNIEPEVISCSQFALSIFSHLCSSLEGLYYILHIEQNETICLLVNDGLLLNSQVLHFGTKNLLEAFGKDVQLHDSDLEKAFQELDFSSVANTSHPLLSHQIELNRVEITKRFYALAKHFPGQEIKNVLLTGGGNTLKNLSKELTSKLDFSLNVPTSEEGINLAQSELQRYAIPIGLALTGLSKTKSQINFRQKELAYPHPWKRLKKPLAVYGSLCLLLSITIFIFGNVYISAKENLLRKKYLNLLVMIKKPFSEVEAGIKDQSPLANTYNISIKDMTQDEIRNRVNLIENEIKNTPDLFPLYPNIPTVGEFLAWLSAHPHISSDGKNEASPKISLDSLSYKMIKRPEANKQKEKYQVKVEIEFTASTPRFAREFHDILLAPNEMVDPREDVKWSTDKGHYRAIFFLKDRTKYPLSKRR